MSEIKFSNFINEDGSHGPDLVGVTTFTSPHYFVPPSGTTAQRPSGEGLAPGMLRFNTDIGRLEVWRGDHWATILGESPSLNGGARGVFGGGFNLSLISTNIIEYVTISTTGNSIDFGDLYTAFGAGGGCSSSTRGIFFPGAPATAPSVTNVIQYVTISSTGNSQDFGDVTTTRVYNAACSNSTRGLNAGGVTPGFTNIIDYVTISSIGNTVDFGDLLSTGRQGLASCSSSTRGVFGGGYAPTASNIIDFVTISTLGNAADFGDLTTTSGYSNGGCSNSTRGLLTASINTNTINYITISTTGNAQDFGDLTVARFLAAACSSPTRGVWGGGQTPTILNTIDYVNILSTGNAIDFGDFSSSYSSFSSQTSAFSNAHGGL